VSIRIELENIQATKGRSLVKLSSKGSKVTMKNVDTWDVENVTSTSNGAETDKENVNKR